MPTKTHKSHKLLPDLQRKLKFTGTNAKFKEYVNIALRNRGPVYQEIFKMYYGIDCRKHDVLEICEAYPGCNVPQIRTLVLNRLEKELPEIIANDDSVWLFFFVWVTF